MMMEDKGDMALPAARATHEPSPDGLGHTVGVANAERTMFLDCNGVEICTGHVVRAPITGNRELHGEWADYTVEKAPGAPTSRSNQHDQ